MSSLQVSAAGDREIVMTREFDAARRLVWDAFTKPELLKRWLLGPPGWTMDVCEVDLRPGGSYRYEWSKANESRMGMSGVYQEVTPPERIVNTEQFAPSWYSGEAVGTLVLVEQDGKTTVTQTVQYESRETRDRVLKSGMADGVAASYDRLAEILTKTLRGGL